MFGRDDEIRQVVEVILEHSPSQDVSAVLDSPARLSILGPGGIGKTSLALSAFHDEKVIARFGDNRLFVSCEAATSVEHIIAELAFSLQITPENTTSQLLDLILYRLKSSFFLLVLDNFETPWELPRAHADTEALLHTLTTLQTVTIIITARGSQHPAGVDWTQLLPPLKPVQVEDAVAIFQTISRKTYGSRRLRPTCRHAIGKSCRR
jgi:predicted ATPase